MNCHSARQLISPYLDQQLTGREMLALQDHFAGCVSCEREMQSVRQVKALLRGLRESRPPQDFSLAVARRLEQADAPKWRLLCLPPSSLVRPQRGRRLASALFLSCLTVVSFALPFAPEAVRSSSENSGSTAFAGPSASDALLTGRMPERTALFPSAASVRFFPADAPSPASGTLILTGLDAPSSGAPLPPRESLSPGEATPSGAQAAVRDMPFGSVQFAAFQPR